MAYLQGALFEVAGLALVLKKESPGNEASTILKSPSPA